MSESPITERPVLVTGGSGFIGSRIVEQLLDGGYRVRAAARDPEKIVAQGHLTALSGATERLELAAVDLLSPDTVRLAVMGCEYVIHTASPYVLDVDDVQRDLLDPAVLGTLSVLEASRAETGLKRVVLTSSVAAMTDQADGHLVTEEDWNIRSSPRRNPYYHAKTLAERAAWDFMGGADLEFDLVAINPFLVIGPSLVPSLNTSHVSLSGLTNGRVPVILAIPWAFVDVRDVARAHVLAMESPAASGRYLVAAGTRTMRQVLNLLRANGWDQRYRFPRLGMDHGVGVALTRFAANFQHAGTRSYLKTHLGGQMRFDNTRARDELGLVFRDVNQTILETMEDLDRWGHLGKKR